MQLAHRTKLATSPTSPTSPALPTSPLQIELRFRLDVSREEAFELVTNRLAEWFEAIHSVRWNHDTSTRGPGQLGACSERVCDFAGKALVERIVEVEPGRRYSYSVDMARSQMKMPIRDHLGSFTIEAGASGTEVIWRQHFRAAWFVPAAMLRWQMRDKMMRPAVDALIARHGGGWLSGA